MTLEDENPTKRIGSQEARAYYPAAIRATAKVLPVAGLLGTVVAYSALLHETPPTEIATYSAIALGVLFALAAWLVAALFYSPSTTVNYASPTNYYLIREQLDRLENQYKYACQAYPEPTSANCSMEELTLHEALGQAAVQFKQIKENLKKSGLPWITGVGYMDLWRRIHRAEEALITVESRAKAIQSAERDKLRLTGSNLTNQASLLQTLDEAIDKLQVASGPTTGPTSSNYSSLENYAAVKSILSTVRYEINSFNDDVWAGIIRARNRLLMASLSLGVAAYMLLMLAIIGGASPEAILWAGIYALVGASVGLFARSRAEATADTATDDFGLSTVRLLHTPIFSGLGAVLGVLVIQILDKHFLGVGSESTSVSVLKDIFSNSPNLLVFAAVFGLVPDLVIQRLTQQAEEYREDLRSTQGNRDPKQQSLRKS